MGVLPFLFIASALVTGYATASTMTGPIETLSDNNQCLQSGVLDRDRWPGQFKRLFSHFKPGSLLKLSDCNQGSQQQWQMNDRGIFGDNGQLMVKRIGRRFIPVMSRHSGRRSLYPVFVEQGRLVFQRKQKHYCITSNAAPFFDIHPLEQCTQSPELKHSSRWLFALPPDPGEAGLVGLTGIDSNSDGIRDDVERLIEAELGEQIQVKEIARKLAVTEQQMMANSNDKAFILRTEPEQTRSFLCFMHLMGAKELRKYRAKKKAQTFNTYERIKAWNKINSYYSGMTFEMPDDLSSQCDFNNNSTTKTLAP